MKSRESRYSLPENSNGFLKGKRLDINYNRISTPYVEVLLLDINLN